jgi:NitT/TauT family transport system permease protein
MVKGLRAPDPMQLDLMRTWNAGGVTQLWKLRLPASLPYLFASLKVGIAASLVGTIVAEVALQQGGLGARMLAGSYYGQTAQIWAALVVAGALAATLVWVIGRGENWALRRQGLTP